jgi:6-phosphogluconolactonase
MYVGSRWTPAVKGLYLYRVHPAIGKPEAAGLATGWLWQSNIDALSGSPSRIFAQLRAEWPHLRKMLRGAQNPAFMVVHPNGRYLYTADSAVAGTVSAFQVDSVSGKLTMLDVKSSGGGAPAFATFDKTGKYLLVANYGGTVAVLPTDATGRLQEAVCVIRHKGSGTYEKRQPHPHSIAVSPDNRFAVVADMGLDELLVYRFDPIKGTLTPNNPPFVKLTEGAAPRHFTFHPNGAFGYVVGEISSSVTALRWEAESGTLTVMESVSTMPEGFHGRNAGAEVLVHPNGRFLYASNRGQDSIAVYAIHPSKGTLTPVQFASTPRQRAVSFLIDPTGATLFAENDEFDNIVQFRIDRQTGELAPVASFKVPSPVCLGFVQTG